MPVSAGACAVRGFRGLRLRVSGLPGFPGPARPGFRGLRTPGFPDAVRQFQGVDVERAAVGSARLTQADRRGASFRPTSVPRRGAELADGQVRRVDDVRAWGMTSAGVGRQPAATTSRTRAATGRGAAGFATALAAAAAAVAADCRRRCRCPCPAAGWRSRRRCRSASRSPPRQAARLCVWVWPPPALAGLGGVGQVQRHAARRRCRLRTARTPTRPADPLAGRCRPGPAT